MKKIKLTLKTDVVRHLTAPDLRFVAAGGTFTSNGNSWCYTCKVTCTG